jgi:hypothetical protein
MDPPTNASVQGAARPVVGPLGPADSIRARELYDTVILRTLLGQMLMRSQVQVLQPRANSRRIAAERPTQYCLDCVRTASSMASERAAELDQPDRQRNPIFCRRKHQDIESR